MENNPIRSIYFEPLRKADACSDTLFYIITGISVMLLFINRQAHPAIYEVAQTVFIALVILNFGLGLAIRLYLTPRAEDKRRQDLLSSSFNLDLIADRTKGYYNNSLADPTRRIAAATLQNSLYSKTLVAKMLAFERTRSIVYLLGFFVLILIRRTDLDMASMAAAAVFSEQIIARWLRMEWFQRRCESTYEALFSLFQCGPS